MADAVHSFPTHDPCNALYVRGSACDGGDVGHSGSDVQNNKEVVQCSRTFQPVDRVQAQELNSLLAQSGLCQQIGLKMTESPLLCLFPH